MRRIRRVHVLTAVLTALTCLYAVLNAAWLVALFYPVDRTVHTRFVGGETRPQVWWRLTMAGWHIEQYDRNSRVTISEWTTDTWRAGDDLLNVSYDTNGRVIAVWLGKYQPDPPAWWRWLFWWSQPVREAAAR